MTTDKDKVLTVKNSDEYSRLTLTDKDKVLTVKNSDEYSRLT